jgi:hypothetical protein
MDTVRPLLCVRRRRLVVYKTLTPLRVGYDHMLIDVVPKSICGGNLTAIRLLYQDAESKCLWLGN